MLERLGTAGRHSITRPDWDVVRACKKLIEGGVADPVVAEIGVGIGATTVQLAKALAGRGELHIFDFGPKVEELRGDLAGLGFTNVLAHGNTPKYWDSYHWSLSDLLETAPPEDFFDLVYVDGAHTYLHDVLIFFMCDRLLKVGGTILFDDYGWAYSKSNYMKDTRGNYMTLEQQQSEQIKRLIDQLVRPSLNYEEVQTNKAFLKTARSTRSESSSHGLNDA